MSPTTRAIMVHSTLAGLSLVGLAASGMTPAFVPAQWGPGRLASALASAWPDVATGWGGAPPAGIGQAPERAFALGAPGAQVLTVAAALVGGMAVAAALRQLMRTRPHWHAAALELRNNVQSTHFLRAAATTLLAAFAEECCFRGFLSAWLGIVAAAIAFAAAHRTAGPYDREYKAGALMLGLACGLLVRWTGSLWAAIALHGTVNLLGCAYLWELKRPAHSRRDQPSFERAQLRIKALPVGPTAARLAHARPRRLAMPRLTVNITLPVARKGRLDLLAGPERARNHDRSGKT